MSLEVVGIRTKLQFILNIKAKHLTTKHLNHIKHYA